MINEGGVIYTTPPLNMPKQGVLYTQMLIFGAFVNDIPP